MKGTFAILAGALLVSGCGQLQQNPPTGCVLPAYRLTLGDPAEYLGASGTGNAGNPAPVAVPPAPASASTCNRPEDQAAPGQQSLVEALGQRMCEGSKASGKRAVRALVLSGGSQHGAFGAGFFVGQENRHAIPDYDVVTGVSTGSLQSTFVFLANRRVPDDIVYPDYMRARFAHPDPELGVPGISNVRNLALAYAVHQEGDLLRVYAHHTFGMGVAAVRHGALASFSPLRQVLTALITPNTIRAVAAEAKTRSLMVAATDIDDGYAYAIDLTSLAAEAVKKEQEAHDTTAVGAAVGCYVDALIASSSVPPGVPPVSLAIRTGLGTQDDLFIDGGARYGVFLDQILKGRTAAKIANPVEMTLLVNGKMQDPYWTNGAGTKTTEWNVLTLAERSSDQLIDQVYRFSVFNEKVWALAHHVKLDYAYISNEGLRGIPGQPDDWNYGGHSCADDYAADARQLPEEFYPTYMRCLIDYGEMRGSTPDHQWNLQYPGDPQY